MAYSYRLYLPLTSVPIHQKLQAKKTGWQKAVLQYRVISVTPDRDSSQNECIRTEFDIKLLTGRHHQIRLQLAHIGYPSDWGYQVWEACLK